MKKKFQISLWLLFLIQGSIIAQNSWVFKHNFQAHQDSIPSVHGVAVDGEGKVWVQPYFASEAVIMNRDIGADGVADTLLARAIYVYNADGTQASFSPLKFIDYGDGKVDTLGYVWYPDESDTVDGGSYEGYSGRGITADAAGNIIISSYNRLYKVDYTDGSGIAMVDPTAGCSLTEATTDDANNVYVGCVVGSAGPLVKFAPDLTGEEAVVTIAGSYSRDMQVSGDGNTIWWAGYTNGAVYRYSRADEFSSFGDADTVLRGLKAEVFDIHPITGHLWVGSGSLNDVPADPYEPQRWYAFDVDNLEGPPTPLDTIAWVADPNNTYNGNPGFYDGTYDQARPRALDFSPDGKIAYVGTFAADNAFQKFTKGSVDNEPGNLNELANRSMRVDIGYSKVGYKFSNIFSLDELKTTDSLVSYQFELELPDGIFYDSLRLFHTESNPTYHVNVEENLFKLVVTGSGFISTYEPLLEIFFIPENESLSFIRPTKVKLNSTPINAEEGMIIVDPFIRGDVDDSGEIDGYDASIILHHTVGSNLLPPDDTSDWEDAPWFNWRDGAADVDQDGQILAIDASLISQYVVGLISEFPTDIPEVESISIEVTDRGLKISAPESIHSINLSLPALDLVEYREPELNWQKSTIAVNDEEGLQLAIASSQTTSGNFLEIPLNVLTNDNVTLEIISHTNRTKKVHQVTVSGLTVSNEDNLSIPKEFSISQNFPNPFNPTTQIEYSLPLDSNVKLEVFNSLGQKVMDLVNTQKAAGKHTATFDASQLTSGLYLYKITTPTFSQTKKMLLIK